MYKFIELTNCYGKGNDRQAPIDPKETINVNHIIRFGRNTDNGTTWLYLSTQEWLHVEETNEEIATLIDAARYKPEDKTPNSRLAHNNDDVIKVQPKSNGYYKGLLKSACGMDSAVENLVTAFMEASPESNMNWLLEEINALAASQKEFRNTLGIRLGKTPVPAEPGCVYVTFGEKHIHRINGETLDKDTIAKVKNRQDARTLFGEYYQATHTDLLDIYTGSGVPKIVDLTK